MSKRQTFCIAGQTFKTKTALQQHIKQILHKYNDQEYLWPQDFSFMLDVLALHPDADIKIGIGIKAIYVKTNPVYKNTRGFWIVRKDDTQTDFSYLECLRETSHKKRFLNACRVAIEPYIINLKNKFFEELDGQIAFCPITGEVIRLTNCHVDHKAPKTFNNIVSSFIVDKQIDVNTVKIHGKGEDGAIQDTFENKELEKIWIDYHNANAELQIVSRRANLSILKTASAEI